jgi:hypothetical protein
MKTIKLNLEKIKSKLSRKELGKIMAGSNNGGSGCTASTICSNGNEISCYCPYQDCFCESANNNNVYCSNFYTFDVRKFCYNF